ncbi:hypothetical protein HK103_002783 [Boothiomyces macroporosus]|uniref:Ankyrin repeat protein n=1 Tax=Boothiomyces macroporosus TaxID=261099 RepID=A0AAD5UMM7_9FUNG|nr:hypothetical protein HK103_002756 [Boothiomyces macroporosus]KAJ3262368.1 hypothetical protein HK103_002783 [Boothiomyces macroporosus]
MIKFKADPNLSWYQVTPLQIACVQGNDQMIQLLLQCGANVNQTLGLADLCLLNRLKSHVPKSSNGSPQNGSPESPSPFKDAFRQYGQKGPITFPQEFINEKEILLYELALASGHETVALQLIELASKAVIAKSSFGLLLSKQINITKLLLHAGVKVDLKDGCGSTALHIAVRRGNLDVVIALVLNGADINCSGFNGWTPLHEAISYSHVLVTHYLLYKSADPSIKNDQGETPVDLAKRIGLDEATIDTLFNQPPDKAQFLEKEKNISAIEISSLANTQMDSPGRPKNEKSKFGLNFLNRTNSGAPVQNVESASRTSLNKPQKRGIFGKASKSNMNL